jgi:hypothetical protein
MEYPIYNDIFNSKDWMVFRFWSDGPKGRVWKVVQFTPMAKRGYYNLAMGDWNGSGVLDFFTQTDNGDRDRILATVAVIVFGWTERFPKRKVIFQGNTLAKTRLYRMAINRAWDELNKVFLIQGLEYTPEDKLVLVDYDPQKVFEGYIVQRRHLHELPNPPP